MALIRDGLLIEDPWVRVDDDAALPAGVPVIVGLVRWRGARDELLSLGQKLGIFLDNDQPPGCLEEDIDRFDLVVLDFPKFTDGRAYSQVRLLRERLGFSGAIRATGQVLRDQLSLMLRCGFDEFEMADDDAVESWARAAHEISVRYQPAADGQGWASNLRQRRPAAPARADSAAATNRARTVPAEAGALTARGFDDRAY